MLTELKEYLRLDVSDTEEDTFLLSLITVAKSYIKNATGKVVDEQNAMHKLAVFLLCTHWYENRNAVLVGTVTKTLEYSLQSILFQMEWGD
ncbi:head-tail connector protein [Paenibacillus sp. NPDC093718]|uniref:head-tail connector protein n=1 Tax=Paenibacillus sp. NPDC093718 TaxID=3390601 RepID=UPI003D043980